MALIKCYECGKEISDTADKCPHCGAPKPNAVGNAVGIALGCISAIPNLIGVAVSIGIIILLVKSCT